MVWLRTRSRLPSGTTRLLSKATPKATTCLHAATGDCTTQRRAPPLTVYIARLLSPPVTMRVFRADSARCPGGVMPRSAAQNGRFPLRPLSASMAEGRWAKTSSTRSSCSRAALETPTTSRSASTTRLDRWLTLEHLCHSYGNLHLKCVPPLHHAPFPRCGTG